MALRGDGIGIKTTDSIRACVKVSAMRIHGSTHVDRAAKTFGIRSFSPNRLRIKTNERCEKTRSVTAHIQQQSVRACAKNEN